ncbi:MAG: hypothetical protein HMLKMBBP_00413 [Planctomycetes bacterium]|nr:hypothetical protein [Planctomycetota bacterium]
MWRRSTSSRSASPSGSDGRAAAAGLGAFLLAAAFALAAGCVTKGGGAPLPPPPAPAAVAAAGPAAAADAGVPKRIAFSHKFHLSRGTTCEDCHEGTETKDRAPMPALEFCMDCHEEIDAEKEPAKTVAAFLDKKSGKPEWSRVTAQPKDIVFSHKTHLAGKKTACADCHRGIEESDAVSKQLFTDMDACMACHASKGATNECATCHSDMGPGWMPPSHQRAWDVMHGQAVRRGAPQGRLEDCALCHTDTTCRSCHSTQPPRDHTETWRAGGGHGLSAALDRERCQTCHQADTCNECHTSLRPRNHRGSWGAPRNAHCNGCHVPLASSGAEDGCSVCHRGAPSHASAPRMPQNPPHTPSMQCRQCHDGRPRLRHADNGMNCLSCHR